MSYLLPQEVRETILLELFADQNIELNNCQTIVWAHNTIVKVKIKSIKINEFLVNTFTSNLLKININKNVDRKTKKLLAKQYW